MVLSGRPEGAKLGDNIYVRLCQTVRVVVPSIHQLRPLSQGELSGANHSRSALQPGQQDTEEMDEQRPVLCSHLVNY